MLDLSQVGQVDDSLLALMHRAEDRLTALDGVFELTGLAPPVLYAMDDTPLAEVFSWYRAVVDDPKPHAALWSSLRCLQGSKTSRSPVPRPGTRVSSTRPPAVGQGLIAAIGVVWLLVLVARGRRERRGTPPARAYRVATSRHPALRL
ncbi:hypothetical protein GCM10022243_11050 [Saccharothrix violaceirubra]|uniref:Uncharacterized protein n=1 Tax=Saccharothrix violaceirubra TaxID=413306 RepID=A0A7W7T9P0_9PSEU|nr:hypothetical protein [Saccharothrix violaceirubra]MBB4968607.1 hypothetical protein [Saccharothrix violaceirubra]